MLVWVQSANGLLAAAAASVSVKEGRVAQRGVAATKNRFFATLRSE
jgi:hypothetical protein